VKKTILLLLFILLGWCKDGNNQVVINTSLPKDSCVFPYSYVNDDKSPRYTFYRAEGSNATQIILHSIKYLRKYKNKKDFTNSAEMKYFENQSLIFDWVIKHKVSKTTDISVKIGLVGDLMWIRNNWSSFLDTKVPEQMRKADFWFGNLETPIDKNKKVKSFFPDYFNYNSDTALLSSFSNLAKSSLFKALSLANNHVFDAGDDGIAATIDYLNKQNILYSGISKNVNDKSYVTFTENGIKFGFYAACWGVNNAKKLDKSNYKLNVIKGIAPFGKEQADLTEIKNVLKEMKSEGVDFKIISIHWGAEYETYPDPQQIIIAREIVESGADIILGHHPHIIQPFEVYFLNGYELKFKNDISFKDNYLPIKLKDESNKPRKALVLYSLGNFTTEMFTKLCQTGILFELNVFRNEENSIDWNINNISYLLNKRNTHPKRQHKLMLIEKE